MSATGIKNIYLAKHNKSKKYVAQVWMGKPVCKNLHLGYFNSLLKAKLAIRNS